MVSLPRPRSAVIGCHVPAFSAGRVRNRLWLPQFQAAPAHHPRRQLLKKEGAARGWSRGIPQGAELSYLTAPEAPPLLRPRPFTPKALPPWGCLRTSWRAPCCEVPKQGCSGSIPPGPHQAHASERERSQHPFICSLFRPLVFACARPWGLRGE